MPTLDWIGKKAVVNHHKEVAFHLLRCDPDLSVGDPESGNLLVQGDNLVALKALLPYYAGKVKCIYIDPPYNTGNEKWVYTDPILVFSGILFVFRPDCGKMTVLIRKICGNRFGKGCFLSSAIFVPKKTKIGSVYNDNVNSPEIKEWLGNVVGAEAEDLSRHDKWLCMMYPRLCLLKDFLTEDGSVWISNEKQGLPCPQKRTMRQYSG